MISKVGMFVTPAGGSVLLHSSLINDFNTLRYLQLHTSCNFIPFLQPWNNYICKCNYLRALSASAAGSLGLGIATQDVVVFLRNIGWELVELEKRSWGLSSSKKFQFSFPFSCLTFAPYFLIPVNTFSNSIKRKHLYYFKPSYPISLIAVHLSSFINAVSVSVSQKKK